MPKAQNAQPSLSGYEAAQILLQNGQLLINSALVMMGRDPLDNDVWVDMGMPPNNHKPPKATNKQNNPGFLTTHQLMERWSCSYTTANEFMHRKGSGAIKPSKLLLIPIKEVEAYEKMRKIQMG